MNIWHRRLYFIIIILLFIIIAPALIFYSIGWRYDFKTKDFTKAGALIVETVPSKATVFLNDRQLDKITPISSNNILPGEYAIKIIKDGYYEWTKDIEIKASQSERIVEINLVKKQHSIQPYLDIKAEKITFSPDKQQISIYYDKALTIINGDNSEIIYNTTLQVPVKDLIWSNDSKKILVALTNDTFLVINSDADNPKINLNDLYNQRLIMAQWNNQENDIIYAASDKQLFRLNIFQKTITPIIDKSEIIYIYSDLLFCRTINGIEITNFENETINEILINYNNEISFLSPINDSVLILDNETEKLYFYKINDNYISTIEEKIKGISWSSKNDQLLYYNFHEIWYWDQSNNTKEIIVRTSEQIIDAQWIINGQYVLYAQEENGLKIIQKQKSEKNSYDIPITDVKKIISNENAKTAYIISSDYLYKLEF